MAEKEIDKVGLIFHIPARIDLDTITEILPPAIKAAAEFHLAEIRVGTAGLDRAEMIKRGDAIRLIGHAQDIAVVIDDQIGIATEIGLDGVHLTRPTLKSLKDAHKQLGKEAIIGVSAGASRHDGISLGEIGADYVAFGPLGDQGFDQEIAAPEIFEWWAQFIELPLVAEGAINADNLDSVKKDIDFVTLGAEVFADDDPIATLKRLLAQLG